MLADGSRGVWHGSRNRGRSWRLRPGSCNKNKILRYEYWGVRGGFGLLGRERGVTGACVSALGLSMQASISLRW